MSRLTEKREKPLTTKWEDVPTSYYKIKGDDTGVVISEIGRLNKLGKLEDLEEQICFDLTTLQNINHIYTYDCENKFKEYEIIGINFVEKKIYFWDSFCPMYLDLADYKKYWWLKEDKSE